MKTFFCVLFIALLSASIIVGTVVYTGYLQP